MYLVSIFDSLKTKLEDTDYLESLSNKRRGEIEICKEMLTEEELENISSIATGYRIARKRYLYEHYEKDGIDTSNVNIRYNSLL